MLQAKHRNLLYSLSLSPAVLCIAGNLNGGFFTLGNTIYSLGILAILEWITPPLSSNLHTGNNHLTPKLILYLHIPFQIFSIGSFVYGIQSGIISGNWIFSAAISTGVNTGSSAIVVAHEWIHRKKPFENFLGRFLLFTAGNMYFFVDHLRVHHKWVGTASDHATARQGENLYFFFIRSVFGQFIGALKLENERMQKAGKSRWNIQHYVIRQIFLYALFDSGLFILGGWTLLGAWFLHCVVANFLLEYVNYVQHYGLVRSDKSRVREEHSWDSDLFVSRFILVDLSRHADHHFYSSKPYHMLHHLDNSPKMPSGYAGMFLLAAIPPLWFSVMHKRLPLVQVN